MASGYCSEQHRYRIFPLLQKVLLDMLIDLKGGEGAEPVCRTVPRGKRRKEACWWGLACGRNSPEDISKGLKERTDSY